MPGENYYGKFKKLNSIEIQIKDKLIEHVKMMSHDIGPRNHIYQANYNKTKSYIQDFLIKLGYETYFQKYAISSKQDAYNIYSIKKGGEEKIDTAVVSEKIKTADEIKNIKINNNDVVVVGAHYDSYYRTPGADDNASGVAVLLELARILKTKKLKYEFHFVAFANEEPPYFKSDEMGSFFYAKSLSEKGTKVKAMYSLECMGYFSNKIGSQDYPFPFSLIYPDTGNFIAFIGNTSSRSLLRDSVEAFRKHVDFPSEGAAVPGFIPGIGWSDHWSFWEEGYPGIMITDTALFRNKHYHKSSDVFTKLNYKNLARVTFGLAKMLEELYR
jgi:Zn-dependent M28 family amino/carboxypeptidase